MIRLGLQYQLPGGQPHQQPWYCTPLRHSALAAGPLPGSDSANHGCRPGATCYFSRKQQLHSNCGGTPWSAPTVLYSVHAQDSS